jgi:hypothetical protein
VGVFPQEEKLEQEVPGGSQAPSCEGEVGTGGSWRSALFKGRRVKESIDHWNFPSFSALLPKQNRKGDLDRGWPWFFRGKPENVNMNGSCVGEVAYRRGQRSVTRTKCKKGDPFILSLAGERRE